MKGRNWREYEPPKKQRTKRRRRRRGGILPMLILGAFIFALGYGGFQYYYFHSKPYLVGLDAGHGEWDVGAQGLMNEVELTEATAAKLKELLEADGRFRVVATRKAGEGKGITERNRLLQRVEPDVVISIHGNSSEDPSAYGFECYPTPPGMENHEKSLAFARILAEEMGNVGARLRGSDGVRFGYFVGEEEGESEKLLVDSADGEIYDYDTFGMLKNMAGAAVLVEQCFITNSEDVAAFATEEGYQKAAEAYYRGICRYVESMEGVAT